MYHSKVSQSVRVSHIEFILANSRKGKDGSIGRVNFFVNNFIEFRNIPLMQDPDGGIHLQFSAVKKAPDGIYTTCLLRDDVREAIEYLVEEKLLEIVP